MDRRLIAVRDSLWGSARLAPTSQQLPARAQTPPPPERETGPVTRRTPEREGRGGEGGEGGGVLPDVFSQYADLNMLIQGRLELGGGWNRFRPCDVALRLNCNPSLVPTLKPELQFGVRLGGTVSERIHVSVDYDNAREFDAANNINVYYQGLEDEILQRLEVGDVSFDLPSSRYLTRAIPAGNFGFKTTGQLGPLEFQSIWAQQKGDLGTRSFSLGAGGQGFVQEETTVIDDADYQRGQFFFLFHPRRIRGFPHIDILRLVAIDADPEFRPVSTIKVYRYEGAFRGSRQGSVQENTIEAIAVALDTISTPVGDTIVADTLRGTFRVLQEYEDYTVHGSALWIVLRSPVGATEGLAVVYRTASGREVGTFDAEGVFAAHVQDSTRPVPVLELLKDVNHRPGDVTWEREMHNIYRVSGGAGVDLGTVDLVLSQGDAALDQTFRLAPSGAPLNFLKIFGLDDEPSDERIDRAHLYQPATEAAISDPSGPTGTFIVFPTLRPFFEPPPLQGLLSDPALNGEPFPLDPGDKNPTIYEDPLDVRRQATNLYRLTLTYLTRSEGILSSFSVGAVGVREGSERISIGGVSLQRGTDYNIDYATGRVDLRDAASWFANNPAARVQVSYEQKPLFQLAPTSVFGFSALAHVGRAGDQLRRTRPVGEEPADPARARAGAELHEARRDERAFSVGVLLAHPDDQRLAPRVGGAGVLDPLRGRDRDLAPHDEHAGADLRRGLRGRRRVRALPREPGVAARLASLDLRRRRGAPARLPRRSDVRAPRLAGPVRRPGDEPGRGAAARWAGGRRAADPGTAGRGRAGSLPLPLTPRGKRPRLALDHHGDLADGTRLHNPRVPRVLRRRARRRRRLPGADPRPRHGERGRLRPRFPGDPVRARPAGPGSGSNHADLERRGRRRSLGHRMRGAARDSRLPAERPAGELHEEQRAQ